MASVISASTTSATALNLSGDTSGILQIATGATPTTAITVDASQNVGIGTSSPTSKLTVNGVATLNGGITLNDYGNIGATSNSAGISLTGGSATNNGGQINLRGGSFSGNANGIEFIGGGTERMRIDSSGNVLVGQTSASGTSTGTTDFYSGGLVINPNNRTSSGSANCVWATGTGQFYRSTSSIKYKQNVNDAEYGLAEVMQLRPVTYQGKSEVDGEKRFGGFIAEEVDAIGLNEFVVYDEQDRPDSLGYDRMVSLLTKAIQELKAIVDTQAEQIKALQGASV